MRPPVSEPNPASTREISQAAKVLQKFGENEVLRFAQDDKLSSGKHKLIQLASIALRMYSQQKCRSALHAVS
jgi:hypothetical protein